MKHAGSLLLAATLVIASAGLARADDDADPKVIENALHDAIDAASPWVVRIDTIGGLPKAPPRPKPAGAGMPGGRGGGGGGEQKQALVSKEFKRSRGPVSGVIVREDGLIVTSTFALSRRPRHIFVTLADGRRFVAVEKGRDEGRGIVCLKVDATDLPVPEAGPDRPTVGSFALALGRGLGGAPDAAPTVNLGVVSAHGRLGGRALQTSARTSPLNYGGALVDARGRALGVIVPLGLQGGQDQQGALQLYGSGIGFAIPWHDLRRIVGKLAGGEVILPGWVGVQLDTAHEGEGVRLQQVVPGSPAAEAGLRAGQIIVSIDGEPVDEPQQVQQALSSRDAGDEVTLGIRRPSDDATWEVRVKLAPRPAEDGIRPQLPAPPGGGGEDPGHDDHDGHDHGEHDGHDHGEPPAPTPPPAPKPDPEDEKPRTPRRSGPF